MSAHSRSSRAPIDRRSQSILREIVQEYVKTGRPVGSKQIEDQKIRGFRSATIRRVMAELDERGYLFQPHTSAGRVPTSKGYQFYVDELTETEELSKRERDFIKRALGEEDDLDELMTKGSQILSSVSTNIGFVLAPPLSKSIMERIEFVKVGQRKILVILVTGQGVVQNKIVNIDEDLSQEELHQSSQYLMENFSGWLLSEIERELVQMVRAEEVLYNRISKNAVMLGMVGLEKRAELDGQGPDFYLGGTVDIFERPEMADIEKIVSLLRTFEKKSKLAKLITSYLESDQASPAVTVGLEGPMQDWAIVSSPYFCGQESVGGLGILGPSRMQYEKTIVLVDYVAQLFGRRLSSN